jgi:hypothetical protein
MTGVSMRRAGNPAPLVVAVGAGGRRCEYDRLWGVDAAGCMDMTTSVSVGGGQPRSPSALSILAEYHPHSAGQVAKRTDPKYRGLEALSEVEYGHLGVRMGCQ